MNDIFTIPAIGNPDIAESFQKNEQNKDTCSSIKCLNDLIYKKYGGFLNLSDEQVRLVNSIFVRIFIPQKKWFNPFSVWFAKNKKLTKLKIVEILQKNGYCSYDEGLKLVDELLRTKFKLPYGEIGYWQCFLCEESKEFQYRMDFKVTLSRMNFDCLFRADM